MASLPNNGDRNWDYKLNDFLRVSHNEDGTHKENPDFASLNDKIIALEERLEMLEDEVAQQTH